MKQSAFWFFAGIWLIAGCQDKPEPIPAYIHINPFTVVNTPGGEAWQKITEGWLYVGDEFIGGYSLPATVPVLTDGTQPVIVFPGVRENGLTNTPGLYPVMQRFETTAVCTPGETVTISPSTSYLPNAIFPWSLERTTFDQTSIVLENRDTDTATTFQLVTDGAFSGRSVKLAVTTDHPYIEIATEKASGLPASDERPVWLEMHYKCNMPFELWLIGQTGSANESGTAVYQFAPTDTWNKIYFNLTGFLINLKEDDIRLYFRAALPVDQTGKYTQDTGEVFIDNLRLVYY